MVGQETQRTVVPDLMELFFHLPPLDLHRREKSSSILFKPLTVLVIQLPASTEGGSLDLLDAPGRHLQVLTW